MDFAKELSNRFEIGQKIKGKYLICDIKENGMCLCQANGETYQFKPLYKNKDTEGILSENAHKLTSIKHPNIHNVEVLEDEAYFYLVSKQDLQAEPLSRIIFQNSEGEVWFEKLFECYLQVCEALKFLHAQNIYHGNISPQNILVESHTYKVFLLDFGGAYYYALLDSNEYLNMQQNCFCSPEQSKNDSDISNAQNINYKTDIFSFGLCMLKMLIEAYDEDIFEEYKEYQDIDKVFEKVYKDKLNDIEKELYPVIKTMLHIEPSERAGIKEVYEKLVEIYRKVRKSYQYEINVWNEEAKKYCSDNNISIISFKSHFQEKLKNSYPHITLDKNKDGKDILKIAFIDIAFLCDAKDDDKAYLFCFKISTSPKEIENIRKDGILLYDSFVITTGSPERKYDDVSCLKKELKEKFEEQQKAKEKLAQDRRAIDTEEKYIQAIEKWLEDEKNTKKVQLKEQNKGSDTLVFDIIDDVNNIFVLKEDSLESKEALAQKIFEDGLSDDPNKDVFKTLQDIYDKDIFAKQSKVICQKIQERNRNKKVPQNLESELNKESKLNRYRIVFYGLYPNDIDKPDKHTKSNKDFKKGDKVIFNIQESNPKYEAIISKVDAIKNTISVKVKKETIREDFDKKPFYFISRDVAIEEGILNKEQRALDDLKNAQTACPRLLSKINQPSLLQDTEELFLITEWFNENLDENQKLAVRKALSLEIGADILLIQGPPGTGKTTTITEIVRQYLKENKHAKILVVSQSNQAVDNVLEKICEEVKVVRIGKIKEGEETKLSKVAQNYTEARVLDTLISDTIKRIKDNPTDKSELKQIQKEFLESLQTLSQKTSETKSLNDKTVDSELADIFLKDIRVIFGTLIGISSYRDFKNMEFELVIVDEAGRAFLSEMLVPLIKAKKIVLVGDHKQLAPIVKDEVEPFLYQSGINKEQATKSFFGRFYEKMKAAEKENFYHFLNANYRSHKNICRLYSEAFYENKLETPDFLERNHDLEFYPSSVILLSTSKLKDKQAKQENNEYGWYNLKHIEIIQKELERIFQELDKKNLSKSIGIISPYRLQVRKLRESLKAFKERVDIGTVDSFQGSDRDIIVYDSVRSGKRGENISFIFDEKRLNVSLSRAKELLIIIGDAEFLYDTKTEGDNPFKRILEIIYNEYKESVIECEE